MAIHSRWSGGDLIFYDGTQDILTIKDDTDGIEFGVDEAGADLKFYGDTASAYMLWDADTDSLVFDLADISMGDTDYIKFGDAPDITMAWNAAQFVILPAADSDMYLGSTGFPLDVVNYGNITYRAPQSQTSTGANITLTATSIRTQFLTSTGAFNLIVPTSSGAGVAGIEFNVFNSTGGACSVCEGTTGTVIVAVGAGESAIVASNATEWRYIVGTT